MKCLFTPQTTQTSIWSSAITWSAWFRPTKSLLRQAFHPACRIIGHYHGDLEWLSLDDFVAAIKAEGPAPSDTKPFWEIQSVDVTGDAAAVKIIDDYMGMRFTDYLSLLQIDGGWVIINKLYFYHA